MSEVKLYKGDCLDVMQSLIEQNISVDFILTDPPYGTVKGAALDGWGKESTYWDNILDNDTLFSRMSNIAIQNASIILFSQEPYTSNIRTNASCNVSFCYPMIWRKDHFANALLSKKAPVSYFEDISVFVKRHDGLFQNKLRLYSKELFDFIGLKKKDIDIALKHQGAQHFFRYDSTQFEIPTEKTYNDLISVFGIDKYHNFMPYSEVSEIQEQFKKKFKKKFNLEDGSKYKSNIFEYKKDYTRFHPTQKPVALLEDLIKTYTNEGDTVLDFTMGSGSTGVACVNTNRKFIGIELDDKYFNIAENRINEAIADKQLTLF